MKSAQQYQLWYRVLPHPHDGVLFIAGTQISGRIEIEPEREKAFFLRPVACRISPGALDDPSWRQHL